MSASASHGRVVSKELQSSKTCKRRAGPITATAGSHCLQAWYVYSMWRDWMWNCSELNPSLYPSAQYWNLSYSKDLGGIRM